MSDHDLRIMGWVLLISLVSVIILNGGVSVAQPEGATIVSNQTEEAPVASAGSLTTAGGTFTTLVLNTTSQNDQWKAYVGNVTGKLTLDDASSQTIYDWNPAQISGEVYVSRNDSIGWGNVKCANRTTITQEDGFFNINSTHVDSINGTFNQTVHQQFYVGNQQIQNSTCPSIATYVNDTKQTLTENADFQEVLLQDNSNLVYSTILEQDKLGYDANQTFDFQLIVPEDETAQNPTTYYFYVEIS